MSNDTSAITLLAKIAAIAALLSGCSLTPDYFRPDMPIPQAWPAPQSAAPAESGKPLWTDTAWREFFPDPALQNLIQLALDNNRDLRVAALNVEVARATYRISEASLVPSLNANATGTISRTPGNASQFVPSQTTTARSYAANVGVSSYELDLFGRVHSLNEQALEQFFATEEARASTQVSLVAEVANAYLTLLGDHKLLSLTNETLDTRLKSLDLIQRSFERGARSELDLVQAKTAVETAQANRARYLRQVDQDRNALTLLVGTSVDGDKLTGNLDGFQIVEDMPVGLPSGVLLRRPDIMQAEHTLKSANANIGAARAAFFPSVTLTGSAGFASRNLTNLFEAGSGAWTFGPSISVPIFDADRNQAGLDSAKASRNIAVAQYEKAIQTAFREVSDALAARRTLTDQMTAQSALVADTQASYRLSQARYDRGVDSYLVVLDSERSLYGAQQDLVTLQVSRLTNLITLYRALGGGRA